MKLKYIAAFALLIYFVGFGGSVIALNFINKESNQTAVINEQGVIDEQSESEDYTPENDESNIISEQNGEEQSQQSDNTIATTDTNSQSSNSVVTNNPPITPSQPPKTTSNPPTNPTPPPAPTPSCGNGGACTVAQVSTHNSYSDCWVIYKSKVYDVTSFVPTHTKSDSTFTNQTCGTDIEIYLNGSNHYQVLVNINTQQMLIVYLVPTLRQIYSEIK